MKFVRCLDITEVGGFIKIYSGSLFLNSSSFPALGLHSTPNMPSIILHQDENTQLLGKLSVGPGHVFQQQDLTVKIFARANRWQKKCQHSKSCVISHWQFQWICLGWAGTGLSLGSQWEARGGTIPQVCQTQKRNQWERPVFAQEAQVKNSQNNYFKTTMKRFSREIIMTATGLTRSQLNPAEIQTTTNHIGSCESLCLPLPGLDYTWPLCKISHFPLWIGMICLLRQEALSRVLPSSLPPSLPLWWLQRGW